MNVQSIYIRAYMTHLIGIYIRVHVYRAEFYGVDFMVTFITLGFYRDSPLSRETIPT